MFSKNFNSEFSYIEVWFLDEDSKPLQMESKKMMFNSIERRDWIFVKGCGFLSFAKIWAKKLWKYK